MLEPDIQGKILVLFISLTFTLFMSVLIYDLFYSNYEERYKNNEK